MDERKRPGTGGGEPVEAPTQGAGGVRPGSPPPGTGPTGILARARTGDAEAWGELYRQYGAQIFRFCRRTLPTREDAEDATMEIFLKVREKLGQYDANRPFGAWL